MNLETRLGWIGVLMVFLFSGGLSLFVYNFELESTFYTILIKVVGLSGAYIGTLLWENNFKSFKK